MGPRMGAWAPDSRLGGTVFNRFSSGALAFDRIDAVHFAQPFQKGDVSLTAYDIPCLGGYLTRVAEELGREGVRASCRQPTGR